MTTNIDHILVVIGLWWQGSGAEIEVAGYENVSREGKIDKNDKREGE